MKKTVNKITKKKAITGERGLPIWPNSKPIPVFKTEAEEIEWWNSYDREPMEEETWQQVTYEPRVTAKAREHVYRVRFDDFEMGILQTLAKRRGVAASVILRELVRKQDRG